MDQNNQYNGPNAWQTNAFNSQFQNNMNPEDFTPSSFGGNPMQPFMGGFYPSSNTMQFNPAANCDGFMQGSNNFQPEVGLFNGAPFALNENINSNPQFPPIHFDAPPMAPHTSVQPPVTDQVARAAELKAQLLKGQKNKKRSATPLVLTTSLNTPATVIESESSLGVPKTPTTLAEKQIQELNVNELISQYSAGTPATNTIVKKEEVTAKEVHTPKVQQQPTTKPGIVAKSHIIPSLRSPVSNGMKAVSKAVHLIKRHNSLSETSEGEILEDVASTPAKPNPPAKFKETQNNPKPVQHSEPRRLSREELAAKLVQRARDSSPYRRNSTTNFKIQPTRGRDDKREEPDQRSERKPHQQENNNGGNWIVPERQENRRGSRDEGYRRPEKNVDRIRPEPNRPIAQIKPPTLQDVLPLDDALREWLDITGYHNAPYRDKILNRRRAIAALDAQRDKLLAEMQAEERNGAPTTTTASSTMLPPPTPNKTETPMTGVVSDPPRDRLHSNKRSFNDDQRESSTPGKVARLEDRMQNGYESYRPPRDNERPFISRDDRDTSYDRYDGRARSRDRDMSPGRRTYESRAPAQMRSQEEAFFDRDDVSGRDNTSGREKRPIEIRGGYIGRAYNPDFRGSTRGRGRGRGRGRSESREPQREESKNDYSAFGATIANGRPFRDTKGFERGGKGDTRYFIVKSFNEENVIRCIEDSVWTTQVQNGEVFKEAFEMCKNVILVFSINRSRAFQGYARMESLPGSVPPPSWQKAINWESTGAFKVKWLAICATPFHKIGHLKNALNEGLAVLIGKDGQEVEEECAQGLVGVIAEEARRGVEEWRGRGRGGEEGG